MNDTGHIGKFMQSMAMIISVILLINILLSFNSSSNTSITEQADSFTTWRDEFEDRAGVNASGGLQIGDGARLLDVGFDLQNWDKKGIVIPNGTLGEHDSTWTMQPYVLKEGNEYRMWYTGYNATAYHIMYATSSDGVTWIKYGPVFGPEYNLTNNLWLIAVPSILKDGNEYRMYYSGSDMDDSLYFNMYMATSSDGINWTDYGMVLGKGENGTTESLGVMNGKVIKMPNDTYKMFYTGYDGNRWRFHLAVSDDGINWERKGMILDIGPAGSEDYEKITEPFVIYQDGTYFMWYTGYPIIGKTVICFATSADGENWTKHGMVMDSSIFTDSFRVGGAYSLVEDDGLVKFWYYGFDGFNHRIHYATKPRYPHYYLTEGELISEIINIPENRVWTSLNINKTSKGDGNNITVSILDAMTGNVIDGFLNLTDVKINLSGINCLEHPSIQLLARFDSNGSDTPVLHTWEVVMKEDVNEYQMVQVRVGELIYFNCTNYISDFGDISNCSWTFEYNRSTITLYGHTTDFMFWTPGNYSVIMEMVNVQGEMKKTKVLIDVSENVGNDAGINYIWLLALVAALSIIAMLFIVKFKKTQPTKDVNDTSEIPDDIPIDIMESIEQRYAEGSISEETYLRLKNKYSK